MRFSNPVLVALVLAATPTVVAWEDVCSPFAEIYANGTELCEVMWGGAFVVVPDEEPGYTMWFFDQDDNPNNDVTRILMGEEALPIEECHLQYFHKNAPSAESDDMRECHPWKNSACCHSDTVSSVDKLRESYGEGFEWDRCGPMSQACERFFVQEACFYECEPNAGLYRKYGDDEEGQEGWNEWQMHQMPIKQSYCDAWYEACRSDYFCGKGDFWECEAHYRTNLEAASSSSSGGNENKGLTIGLSVVGAFAALAVIAMAFLIHKEKKGEPYFADDSKAEDHEVS